MSTAAHDVGVVLIGRNEGERLRRCLMSVLVQAHHVVYVDSGSSDGSRELAHALGAEVIQLDLIQPFTAARARNSGWRHLAAQYPALAYIQFVDGDCEMDAEWIGIARQHLEENPQTAVACGRRRERFPEASVYNRLCDVEWNTPLGITKSCGGDALMRLKALADVDGFEEFLIAGEEPELCFRLRQKGWNIHRLPAEMTRHDAAMHSFRQWWLRSRRSGYSYAQGFSMHGSSLERFGWAELRSIAFWGFVLPATTFLLSLLHPLGGLVLLAYPVQYWRLHQRFLSSGRVPRTDCAPYALNCVACKFPELVGALGFYLDRALARRRRLIEYK